MNGITSNIALCNGTFFGGEIEPGTFHGGEIEPGTFHQPKEQAQHSVEQALSPVSSPESNLTTSA